MKTVWTSVRGNFSTTDRWPALLYCGKTAPCWLNRQLLHPVINFPVLRCQYATAIWSCNQTNRWASLLSALYQPFNDRKHRKLRLKSWSHKTQRWDNTDTDTKHSQVMELKYGREWEPVYQAFLLLPQVQVAPSNPARDETTIHTNCSSSGKTKALRVAVL